MTKFKNGISVDGGVSRETSGSNKEVFTTDGNFAAFSEFISSDAGNHISAGVDGKIYFNHNRDIEAHIGEMSAFRHCEYLHNIADDFSDLQTRADAHSAPTEMFAFSLVSGGFGIAVKDGSDYDPTGLQVGFLLTSSGESGYGLTKNGVYWWNKMGIGSQRTGYKTWTQSNLSSDMSAVSADSPCFVWMKPVQAGSGGSEPTIVSTDANNDITEGGDGGAYLQLPAAQTIVSSDANNGITAGGDGGAFFEETPNVSTDANNDITAGGDGGAYLQLPAAQTIVSTDANNDITAGGDGGAFFEETPNVSTDANNALSAGGDGGAFLNTSALGGTNNVEFYADVASLPATGTADVLYVAKAEDSLHEWNGSTYDTLGSAGGNYGESDVIGTSRQYTQQQNGSQVTLTDAATLSWDLDTAQAAKLTATSGVGNLRTLPNSVLTPAVEGGNYQLTFIQDETGGRSISFDTNFVTVGAFDTRANQVTIITINVQGGIGYVCINSFEGLVSGLSNGGTGVTLLNGSTIRSIAAGTNIDSIDLANDTLTINATTQGGGGAVLNKRYVYVDYINGDDGTGIIEDYTQPFKDLDAALAALPAVVNEEVWVIELISASTNYTISTTLPGRNLVIQSSFEVTITAVTKGLDRAVGGEVFHVNMPKGTIVSTLGTDQDLYFIRVDGIDLVFIVAQLNFIGSISRGVFQVNSADAPNSVYIRIGRYDGQRLIDTLASNLCDIYIGEGYFDGGNYNQGLVGTTGVSTGSGRGKIRIGYASPRTATAVGGIGEFTNCDVFCDRFESFGADTTSTNQYHSLVELNNSSCHFNYAELSTQTSGCMYKVEMTNGAIISGNFYNLVHWGLNVFRSAGGTCYCRNVNIYGVTTSQTADNYAIFGHFDGTTLLEVYDCQVYNCQTAIYKITATGGIKLFGTNVVSGTGQLTSTNSTGSIDLLGRLFTDLTGGGATINKLITLTEV